MSFDNTITKTPTTMQLTKPPIRIAGNTFSRLSSEISNILNSTFPSNKATATVNTKQNNAIAIINIILANTDQFFTFITSCML